MDTGGAFTPRKNIKTLLREVMIKKDGQKLTRHESLRK